MVEFQGKLLFSTGRSAYYDLNAVWISDGTLAGTEEILKFGDDGGIVPGVRDLVSGERSAYFVYMGLEPELWQTDGTPEGTRVIFNGSSIGRDLVFIDDILFFNANDGLWRTDGTETGTWEVKGGVKPSSLEVIGSSLFFAGEDAEHGREIWISDGTTEGTRLHVDVAPGRSSSNPTELTGLELQTHVDVYFVADDGVRGRELWRLVTPKPIVGDIDGDGELTFADFLLLSSNFGRQVEDGVASGDLNEDGQVDFADFLLLSQQVAALDLKGSFDG